MVDSWRSTVTSFAVARRGVEWLMVRHNRLGLAAWEVPGGHVDHAETLEDAAARETLEETGVTVAVGRLLATCVHEWHERRRRSLVCFFDAVATGDAGPAAPPTEPEVLEAAWIDPLTVRPVSAFLAPLFELEPTRHGVPLHFHMTHVQDAAGRWEPRRVTG